MWTHLCKPQKAWLNTEKGAPCNWCDTEEYPYDEWDNRKRVYVTSPRLPPTFEKR
jgi:hypothetical protein